MRLFSNGHVCTARLGDVPDWLCHVPSWPKAEGALSHISYPIGRVDRFKSMGARAAVRHGPCRVQKSPRRVTYCCDNRHTVVTTDIIDVTLRFFSFPFYFKRKTQNTKNIHGTHDVMTSARYSCTTL